MAPWVGIEPTTNRLTGDRSTAELPRNIAYSFVVARGTAGYKYFSGEKFRNPDSHRRAPSLRCSKCSHLNYHGI